MDVTAGRGSTAPPRRLRGNPTSPPAPNPPLPLPLKASPSAAGCELAASFVKQFCTSSEAYASFASLLGELSAAALPALRRADTPPPEELLTAYLELCALHATL